MARDDAGEAFAAFVRSRSPALARTAYLLCGDYHRSEDLLQTALYKAARVWPKIEANPEPYVRRILYHENISWWRGKRLREVSLDAVPEPREPADDADARIALVNALARLTSKQRTVLVLRYFEDLTEAQTAAELGVALGTVKSHARQALAKLRELAPDLQELISIGGDQP